MTGVVDEATGTTVDALFRRAFHVFADRVAGAREQFEAFRKGARA